MVILLTTNLIKEAFFRKLAALAIVGAIKGISQTKLYNELEIQFNETQEVVQVSLLFFQNTIEWFTSIFKWLIPKPSLHYTTRFWLFINFKFRVKLSWNSFFPYTVNEWSNLENITKPFESCLIFRKIVLTCIRLKCVWNIQNWPPNWIEVTNASTIRFKSS